MSRIFQPINIKVATGTVRVDQNTPPKIERPILCSFSSHVLQQLHDSIRAGKIAGVV